MAYYKFLNVPGKVLRAKTVNTILFFGQRNVVLSTSSYLQEIILAEKRVQTVFIKKVVKRENIIVKKRKLYYTSNIPRLRN